MMQHCIKKCEQKITNNAYQKTYLAKIDLFGVGVCESIDGNFKKVDLKPALSDFRTSSVKLFLFGQLRVTSWLAMLLGVYNFSSSKH